jgi:hypothetical protein
MNPKKPSHNVEGLFSSRRKEFDWTFGFGGSRTTSIQLTKTENKKRETSIHDVPRYF